MCVEGFSHLLNFLSQIFARRNGNGGQQRHQRLAASHNRSLDVMAVIQPTRRRSTVYAYSSSDDDAGCESLNVSFIPMTSSSVGDDDDDEEETVIETLCDEASGALSLPHASSTPSLAVAGNAFSSWQMIGSSSSTPRPVARASKQRHLQLRSSAAANSAAAARAGGSSSTDDPPGLYHLLQQTANLRSTLSVLEADFGASRRDVGWLQENLSTVQSCAANVSDKVVKMQSQVTSMERQISATVKVLLSSTQNGRA